MGQRTYHNKLRRYQRLRQKQTEQQYEDLTERHIIRPAHPKYAVLNHFSHVANNVYNQGLYRAVSVKSVDQFKSIMMIFTPKIPLSAFLLLNHLANYLITLSRSICIKKFFAHIHSVIRHQCHLLAGFMIRLASGATATIPPMISPSSFQKLLITSPKLPPDFHC